jgi:hypothetical protein
VRNYEALWNRTDGNEGSANLNVYGVFKPMNNVGAYYGCALQNGSAIDFTGWPAKLGWPMYSRASGTTTLKFATGATVTVKLAGRADIGQLVREKTYLLKWNTGTKKPENVTFVLEESLCHDNYRLETDETGVRLTRKSGFSVIIR